MTEWTSSQLCLVKEAVMSIVNLLINLSDHFVQMAIESAHSLAAKHTYVNKCIHLIYLLIQPLVSHL